MSSINDIFKPVITTAGLQAVLAAGGVALTVAECAVGTGAYEVRDGVGAALQTARDRTALDAEVERFALVGLPPDLNNKTMMATGVLPAGPEFSATEIGFFLADGTLLAVASHPTQPFFVRSTITALPFIFALALNELDAGSVTINLPQDPSVAALLAQIVQMDAMIAHLVNTSGFIYDPTQSSQLYDGVEALIAAPGFLTQLDIDPQLALKADLAGAVFSGNISVPNPLLAEHATPKSYIDAELALKADKPGAGQKLVAVTDTVLTSGDGPFVFVDVTSGPVLITLPPGSDGLEFHIKDLAGLSRTNAISIQAAGVETIDGLNIFTIRSTYAAVRLVWVSGTGWAVI